MDRNTFDDLIRDLRRHIEATIGRHPEDELAELLEEAIEKLSRIQEELDRREGQTRSATERLERERQRYRLLFELAPVASIVTDLNGVVREANLAAADLLRIEPRFLNRKPLVAFVAPESRAAFRSELIRLRQGAERIELVLRLTPRRGGPLPATAVVSTLRRPMGEPEALLWSIRDDTVIRAMERVLRDFSAELERRVVERTEQLQAELHSKEELLIRAHAALASHEASAQEVQDVVEDIDAIIWIWDIAAGRHIYLSRRAADRLGAVPPNDLDAWYERIEPDDREYARVLRVMALERGRAEGDYRLRTAEGNTLWVRESIRTRCDAEGRPIALHGLIIDISRRKRVERQLYHAKSELAAKLRDTQHLHELGERLLARGDDVEALADEILGAALGLQGAEAGLLVRPRADAEVLELAAVVGLLPEVEKALGSIPAGEGALSQAIASGMPLVLDDLRTEPEDSPLRRLAEAEGLRSGIALPLLTSSGVVVGAIVAFFPKAHRPPERHLQLVERYARMAADALAAAHRLAEAREAQRHLEVFLTTLSHELRSPLSALRTAVEVLRSPDLDPAGHDELHAVIVRQVKMLRV